MRPLCISLKALLVVSVLIFASCGGGSTTPVPPPPPSLTVTLSVSTLTALQDGTPASVDVTVTRPAGVTADITLTVSSLPAGGTTQIVSPGSGTTGKVTFSMAGVAAGTYTVTINAAAGASTGSANLTLVNEIVATVGLNVDSTQGINGRLNEFMSTSFQLASWSDTFFQNHPDATMPLDGLNSQHIRMQVVDRDIPWFTTTSWDFTYLDSMVKPILTVTDHNPEFQIAKAPAFQYKDSQGNFVDATYGQFAEYAKDLVLYYNGPNGFTDTGGTPHKSASNWPIKYWGIYNEPNINDVFTDSDGSKPQGPLEYVKMYNAVVPQMLAADSTIKILAVELADWSGEAQYYLPTFVSGVTAQVDYVATHFYASCNQKESDQQLMSSSTEFVSELQYIRQQLQANPTLANVPLWLTENNVNADWSNNGTSMCNGGPFTADGRGSSAFFAAWRPLVFSLYGKAGVQALYHWAFAADIQYGEINGDTEQKYLSYWVDYYLERYFPAPPGQSILQLTTSEPAGGETVEVLPVRYDDGSVVVMIANHAILNPSDDNGPGAPRSVLLDLSALGAFTTGTQLTIDASTDTTNGPTAPTITPAPQMQVTLNGYGVTFLQLKP